jgi:hypothetical protein
MLRRLRATSAKKGLEVFPTLADVAAPFADHAFENRRDRKRLISIGPASASSACFVPCFTPCFMPYIYTDLHQIELLRVGFTRGYFSINQEPT